MFFLSADLSSTAQSLSLAAGDVFIEQRSWDSREGVPARFFVELKTILDRHAISREVVEWFAVGLGPGQYSGLRVSLAAAQAFALPGSPSVYGVSSAAVAAFRYIETYSGVETIAVTGDARQGIAWLARFRADARSGVFQEGPVRLFARGDINRHIEHDAVVCVTEYEPARGDKRVNEEPPALGLHLAPDARTLWRLCRLRINNGIFTEPLTLNYAYPPVRAISNVTIM